MASLAVLPICLLALLLGSAHALLLPPSSQLRKEELIPLACAGVPAGLTVCHPYGEDMYIHCKADNPKVKSCSNGASRMRCPAPDEFTIGVGGVSPPLGPGFGQQANFEIELNETGSTKYFCPVIGHCVAGMYFEVTVLPLPAPTGYVSPCTTEVPFYETLGNSDLYPTQLPDVTAYVGDKLHIMWRQPTHILTSFNNHAEGAGMVTPYPPQPIYKCPDWSEEAGDNGAIIIPLQPGETRLLEVAPYDMDFNVTVDMSHDGAIFACPLSPHCRMGQVFKVSVMESSGDEPVVHDVDWMLKNYQNFADLELHEGDIIRFMMGPINVGPQGPDVTNLPIHGISLFEKGFLGAYIEV